VATTGHTYTKLALSLATKKVDLTADTIKVMLLSAYTVGSTQDTAQYVSDVLAVATEATGTGYSAGGVTLSSRTFAETGHVYALDGADPQWAASTVTASYALFYDATPGTNATNPVIGYLDFGGAQSTSGTTFKITLNAAGLLALTGS
jgi:hypothetical protein